MTVDEQLTYAFEQRDELLVFLSRRYPSYLCDRVPDDPSDADWPLILCIDGYAGPMYWHIHKSRIPWFAHVPRAGNSWDGSDRIERDKRLRACAWRET